MSYPPQQPGPPGPQHGQPGYGGNPNSGAYPQSVDPSVGGKYSYPQQPVGYFHPGQYGQAPYGQPGGLGGPPPPKSKTGVVVGLSVGGVALVVVGVFLVTAFLVPGFLATGSDSVRAANAPVIDTSDQKLVRDEFLKRISNGYTDGALALMCPRGEKYFGDFVRRASRAGADLTAGKGNELEHAGTWDIRGTVGGSPIRAGHLTLRNKGAGFCITTVTIYWS